MRNDINKPMTCHIRWSYKPGKVHTDVSENKPKKTPTLKQKIWFTLVNLSWQEKNTKTKQQPKPPTNQNNSLCVFLVIIF